MPNYTYKCKKCQTVSVQSRPIADRHIVKKCESCGGKLIKMIDTPEIGPMFKPYVNHILDIDPVVITSKAQERYEYQKRGVFK